MQLLRYGSTIFVLGVCCAVIASSPWIASRPEVQVKSISAELQDGDLIFQRGSGILTRAVLSADDTSPFSHVGLIVLQEGQPMVVHATPGPRLDKDTRVALEPLTKFLGAGMEAAVYRVLSTAASTPDVRHRAAMIARGYVNERRSFDAALDLDTEDRLYCTELVWRAYREAGLDLADDRFTNVDIPLFDKTCLLPSGLLLSPHVQLVHEFHIDIGR